MTRSSPETAELRFGYTNYRGETSERRVRPISIRYGNSEYHRADDWLLLAFDLDKNAEREFSMHDMVLVQPADALLLAHAQCAPTEQIPVGYIVRNKETGAIASQHIVLNRPDAEAWANTFRPEWELQPVYLAANGYTLSSTDSGGAA